MVSREIRLNVNIFLYIYKNGTAGMLCRKQHYINFKVSQIGSGNVPKDTYIPLCEKYFQGTTLIHLAALECRLDLNVIQCPGVVSARFLKARF